MLKLKCLLLSLLATSSAQAADLVPTEFKPFEVDLARPELKLTNPFAYRLGINFVEGHNFTLHPLRGGAEKSSSIRREYSLSVGLPMHLEVGLSIYDSQQGAPEAYGKVEHRKQHLGGAAYVRYHLVSTDSVRSSAIIQYEPGTADRYSFHQASQDKTSFAIQVDGTFLSQANIGAFIGGSRRNYEKYRDTKLNDEILYGMRLSYGPHMVRLFTEAQARSMPWKSSTGKKNSVTSKHFEIGIDLAYKDFSVQLSKFVPTKERYAGEPEQGFQLALQYKWGAGKTSVPKEKSPAPSELSPVKSQDNLDELSQEVKTDELGQIPVFEEPSAPESKEESMEDILATPGADEFEKWNKVQEAEKKRPETAAEKAEREYKAQVELEKKQAEAAAKAQAAKSNAEQDSLRKELEKAEAEASGSREEIEAELNQYTLPDTDDVNWNGLND